jgi:hypothetical protein
MFKALMCSIAMVAVIGLPGLAAPASAPPGGGSLPEGEGLAVRTEDGPVRIAFDPGGSDIRWVQGTTLKLFGSNGWVYSLFPREINLDRCRYLALDVMTKDQCKVFFELKDRNGEAERPLIGKEKNNGWWKMPLSLPDTGGKFQSITVDLGKQFWPATEPRLAKVIALSDPSGYIEIRSITFASQDPADAAVRQYGPLGMRHIMQSANRIAAARAKLPGAQKESASAHALVQAADRKVTLLRQEIETAEEELVKATACARAKAKEMEARKAACIETQQELKRWNEMSRKVDLLESEVRELAAKLNAGAARPAPAAAKREKMLSGR